MKIILSAAALLIAVPCSVYAESAKLSEADVYVNGQLRDIAAYNIGGNNYFRLRDAAEALSGTEKQFNVSWSDRIDVSSGSPYKENGGECAEPLEDAEAIFNVPRITIGGFYDVYAFAGYNINGNNYFKLRDMAWALDFETEYRDGAIYINTDKPYVCGVPEQRSSAVAYEAAMPLFISEMPIVSYYCTCNTVYDNTQLERIREVPRLNSVYIDVMDLDCYGFDITEDENSINAVYNREKAPVWLSSEIINSAPDMVYNITDAEKKVYLDGAEVKSINADGHILIAASELMRLGEIQKLSHITGFPTDYDERVNIDIEKTQLEKLYESSSEEPVREAQSFMGESTAALYKPSVGIGKISFGQSSGYEKSYIGGCSGLLKEGTGISDIEYNPSGGAGLAPTRFTGFERGSFINDKLTDGISYKSVTYGIHDGKRIEGARINGHRREASTLVNDDRIWNNEYSGRFRFGYRIVCEGEIENGEYVGECIRYDEKGVNQS